MAITESHRKAAKKYASKPCVKEHRKKLNRDWIAKNRERYNEAKSEYRFKLKLSVIAHYSAGSMACALCGYDADVDALCLDHINDDGAQHRKELGVGSRSISGGTTIYERIKALGFLPGLQVLCANCNTVKAVRLKRGRTSEEMKLATAGPTRWRKVISHSPEQNSPDSQ